MERRAVIVGAGTTGRTWAKNLHVCPGVQVAGWVDPDDGKAAEAAAELDMRAIIAGSDLGRVLRDTRPDVVVDATSPDMHKDVTVTSLRLGIPVLGEKPMATTLGDARAMVRAADETGTLYVVSQSRRYSANLTAYKRLVDKLGPLGILNADFFVGTHFGGSREKMEHPLLLDMAIHTFDTARYLVGADAETVYCESFNPPWSWFAGDACADALFDFVGGLRFTFRGGCCVEGRHTSWDAEWRAVGSQGSATWDGSGAPHAELVKSQGGFYAETTGVTEKADPTALQGINGVLRCFLGALDGGDKPMGECHDNIKSLAMVFAAIESSATGQRVSLAPMLA